MFFKENSINYYVTQNPDVKKSELNVSSELSKRECDEFYRNYYTVVTPTISIKMPPTDINEKYVYIQIRFEKNYTEM
ncbi:hypothetical protein J437_LFUL016596 [Ladona fulva]|uniref:Uncharacterized protein n=1 Tax=Ladona fulva TaxID=123851 RepID=A0A8K0KR01_LADFU|nr:hypothetical protein J437_LFUL016596 [Ladona fulva]